MEKRKSFLKTILKVEFLNNEKCAKKYISKKLFPQIGKK